MPNILKDKRSSRVLFTSQSCSNASMSLDADDFSRRSHDGTTRSGAFLLTRLPYEMLFVLKLCCVKRKPIF